MATMEQRVALARRLRSAQVEMERRYLMLDTAEEVVSQYREALADTIATLRRLAASAADEIEQSIAPSQQDSGVFEIAQSVGSRLDV